MDEAVFRNESWEWRGNRRVIQATNIDSSIFPELELLSPSHSESSITANQAPSLPLTCSWCGRPLTFNTVTLSRGFKKATTFGTVWVLDCGHLLDSFCVASLLTPNECDTLEISIAAEKMGAVYELYEPVCVEKIYTCRGRDCTTSFSTVARHSNLTESEAAESRLHCHAPGSWTFAPSLTMRCSLIPFANHWSGSNVHGTLDILEMGGYHMVALFTHPGFIVQLLGTS
ncbi:hypothetical protein BDZ89DRAFT_1120751 [Hymenopellis radicata]|nr:hypothetical protein BDZ89DRAFT_1120751 [Hymenopellis radicata]